VALDEGGTLIIDPGDEAARVAAACRSLPPVAILLTHGHYDHVAAAGVLAERFGVPIYAHQADRPWLDGTWNLWGLRPPALPCRFFQDAVPLASVQVIHTPGHSPGSVCYVVGSVAYVGDTLFAGSVGRTDLPGGDEAVLRDSLRKLVIELGAEDVTVAPGHGPLTTLTEERRTNPWLRQLHVGQAGE
jgi:glyoxylase-like metal-dependent hydrolase (beta-lactamase superfamily II)